MMMMMMDLEEITRKKMQEMRAVNAASGSLLARENFAEYETVDCVKDGKCLCYASTVSIHPPPFIDDQ